jgi:hypothetical protein
MMSRSPLVLALFTSLTLLGCGSSMNGGDGGAGGNTTTTSTITGDGYQCASNADCAASTYCELPNAACGHGEQNFNTNLGMCTAQPDICDGVYEPACGCDGKVYPSSCAANAAGVSLGRSACSDALTPEGYLRCGPHYCDPRGTYCKIGEGDTDDYRWECPTLPAGCDPAAPDCACLDAVLPDPYFSPRCSVIQGNGVSGLRVDYIEL